MTSSLDFFPGLPIYHSKNLANWELIAYALTRESQMSLTSEQPSQGIYAPTLRYHDGKFYIISTNVTQGGNFLIMSDSITGPWSDPVWIRHAGIDPSLYFDEAGKAYCCATDRSQGRQGIVLFELDVRTGELLSPPAVLTYGAGGKFPEAPHLYKIKGFYYLVLAEGGTEYGHRVTAFRSEHLSGPYDPCPHNPVLSHMDDMYTAIQAIGHADLVEDQHANWWAVCLGIRLLPAPDYVMLHNLGRETFLVPVAWDEDGWPIMGQQGKVSLTMDGPLPAPANPVKWGFKDEFTSPELKLAWNAVQIMVPGHYRTGDGFLQLTAGPETLNDPVPTFLGIRQPDFEVVAETSVLLETRGDPSKAGITAYYNRFYHYELYLICEQDCWYLELAKHVHDLNMIAFRLPLPEQAGPVKLRIITGPVVYTFQYSVHESPWQVAGTARTAGLCTEGTMNMTFTGTYLGLFASSAKAEFHGFELRPIH